jgi:hypothetical protein
LKPAEAFILNQPEKFEEIILHLIAVVNRVLPEAALLFKYGVPYFYYKKKPLCYMAPNAKKGFVDLGFAKGFQLTKQQEFLVSENRNIVKSLRYFNLNSIDNAILEAVVKEASSLY